VVLLALFPPFHVAMKIGKVDLDPAKGFIQHQLLTHSGEASVNVFEGKHVDFGFVFEGVSLPRIITKEIRLPTLLCELLFLSTMAGLVFVSMKGKKVAP